MKIIDRGKIVYYIKEESVVVGINKMQYISYSVYSLQNRTRFNDFKKSIEESKETEYADVISFMNLTSKYKLLGSASQNPVERNNK